MELEINLSVREYYERACAHVNRKSTRSHTTAPVCTRISFRARAVRATVTLTTFPHYISLGRPPLRPSAHRPTLQCRLRWEARGKARATGDVTHCVHCDAVQRRRRFLPCSVRSRSMRRRASRWQYCSAQTHPPDVGNEDGERERQMI